MKPIIIESKPFVASFDVDAQKTFTPLCPDELPVPHGDEIADALNAQAAFACVRLGSKEAHSKQAIWVATADKPVGTTIEGENVDVRWPVHAVPGTKGFELIDGLPSVSDYDYLVWKGVELDMHPYGSCYHDLGERISTGVIEFLKDRHIKTVLIGGLTTEHCVMNTALQLLKAGFRVILNLSACRGLKEETTRKGIAEMKRQGIIVIDSLDQIQQVQEPVIANQEEHC